MNDISGLEKAVKKTPKSGSNNFLLVRASREEEAFQAKGVGLMMEVCKVKHEGRYSDNITDKSKQIVLM